MISEMQKRRIAILGSTGSIGTQALDAIAQHPEMFEVELLTANNNSTLLIEQAIKFQPNSVVICNEDKYEEVAKALEKHYIKVFAGIESVCDLVSGSNIDMVLTAMVGFAGLKPTISAIKAGKVIALANKETLVAAGEIITSLAMEYEAPIIPVDSEHSAIFQCLQGERSQIEKILLTASGGPFFSWSKEQIAGATKEMALKHPRWKMGAKVTIDSASLMNKGLEVIEARWLFNVQPEEIQVVIHPESIIHSMVQFHDGSVIAQLGSADMRIPILYALSYPFRSSLNSKRVAFEEIAQLTFAKPDLEKFPCLNIAYQAIKQGGNAPCAMNAANEVAVSAFMKEQIRFVEIPEVISATLEKYEHIAKPDLEAIYGTNLEVAQLCSSIIKAKTK